MVRWFLVSVTAALVFATAATATPTLPDPCSLLTGPQVAQVIGAAAVSRTPGGNRLERNCTWVGPPQGYMQLREQLMVDVFRVPEGKFISGYEHEGAEPVAGLGKVAYSDKVGLAVWEKGLVIELDGSYFGVDPAAGRRLARAVVGRL